MTKRFWLAMGSAVVLSMAACGGDDDDDDSSGSELSSGATCPTDSTLTYDNFARGFSETYCTSCHGANVQGAARQGAPADDNFDSLAGLKAIGAKGLDVNAGAGPTKVNTGMPPASFMAKPPEAERRKFSEWLACGMK